jgi:hypothetical protein
MQENPLDYAGEPAGPTVGSHRIAVWAKRWTKSTRAFAPRNGANAANQPPLLAVGCICLVSLPLSLYYQYTSLSKSADRK